MANLLITLILTKYHYLQHHRAFSGGLQHSSHFNRQGTKHIKVEFAKMDEDNGDVM